MHYLLYIQHYHLPRSAYQLLGHGKYLQTSFQTNVLRFLCPNKTPRMLTFPIAELNTQQEAT